MKQIKGFEGLYSADKRGFIWSHRQEKRMKTFINNSRYECLVLNTGKNPRKFLVHRLIAQTFIIPPKEGIWVNHIDGNKLNNRIENLEWCTPRENIHHAMENGLVDNRGENHGSHKLTDKKVREIKKLLRERATTKSKIARRFHVSPSTIGDISFGKMWTHIE